VITGALGFIWVAAWSRLYHLPQDHPRLSDAEKKHSLSNSADEPASVNVAIRDLLRMRETWGCILARVCTDPISYFLFFWTPKYFQQERGFALGDVALYLWIPYIALTAGNIASGAVPRYLIGRGWSVNRARKSTMLTVSCLMPVFCLLVTRVSSPSL